MPAARAASPEAADNGIAATASSTPPAKPRDPGEALTGRLSDVNARIDPARQIAAVVSAISGGSRSRGT